MDYIVLKDVPVREFKNTVECTLPEGVSLVAVEVYTPEPLSAAYDCGIKPEYDYLNNRGEGAKVPALVYEAEDADLSDSVSSREEVDLIELDIYENTGKTASGNSAVGNFARAGNVIRWEFTSSAETVADITFMLASANYSSAAGGNTLTEELQNRIVIRINGVAVRLENLTLTVDSLANYYDWKAVTVSGCLLKEGVNEVTIECLASGAPNMDVLYVYTDGAQLEACNP